MIYLDNSATTRLDERVLEAMLPWLKDDYGNASSIYGLGRKARVAIEDARTEIASLINAHPAELIFTSGGTESNNAVLHSCVEESDLVDVVAVSSTEHHSVLGPSEELLRRGHVTHFIPVNNEGRVDVSTLKSIDGKRTLISVMMVNNETGVLQSIRDLRAAAPASLIHTDAVQAFGKVPLNVQDLGVDFATISSHKIHGPKGVGAMFIRKGIDFKAHQLGGGQERNRRAGTESPALIVGFQTAARIACEHLQADAEKMFQLTERIIQLAKDRIPDIRINTPTTDRAPHIVNISFKNAERIDGEAILQAMDMNGVAVSNGSACVSGSLQPSHVLLAMGLSKYESKAAVRMSVGRFTTQEDVDTAVTILADIYHHMRV